MLDGVGVVRGRGRRAEYRPVTARIADGDVSEPRPSTQRGKKVRERGGKYNPRGDYDPGGASYI